MKRLFLFSCVCLILLLAGASTAVAKGQGEKPKELEKVEISWWLNPWRIVVPGVPTDKVLDGTEFIQWASKTYMEAHPNVTVTGVMVSNAEFNQKQAAAIAAGNTPNVSKVAGLVELSKGGLLQPLDSYLTAADKADFIPVALADGTVDGKVMSFPWNFGNNGMGITNLIYPPMFEAAGVDWKKIVDKGWTTDEFVEIGKKVSKDTNGDGQNDVFLTGFQGKAVQTADWPYVYNFGGRLLNDKETAFTVDSPEMVAGFQFIVDAIYKHNIAPKGAEALDNYGVITPFHQHKLAMGNGGPYEIGRIDREVKAGNVKKFRPYVAPYPEVPGKKRGTLLTSGGFSVFKKAKTPATLEAAVDFAKYLTSKDMLVRLETLLYISGRKSANAEMYKSAEWQEFKPDIALYEKEISDYGVPFFGSQGFSPTWNKVSKYMVAAAQAIYARTKTPEQAMKDFIKDAKADAGF
jgi:multiple sugar transport system substrate-binding protein